MTALFRKKPKPSSSRGGPQGLRRPRFSFFRFTCQTARKPCGFPPLGAPGRRTKRPTKFEPPTTFRRSCPHISEELLEARFRAVKRTARRMSEVIWAWDRPCQHESLIWRTAAFPAIPVLRPSLRGSRPQTCWPHLGHIHPPFWSCWGAQERRGIPSKRHNGSRQRVFRQLTGARASRHRVRWLDSTLIGIVRS